MSIYQKLLVARKELGPITASQMSFKSVKYDYLSEVQITTKVKEIFDRLGILIYPTMVLENPDSKGGLTSIIVTYTVVDSEDSSSIEVSSIGQGYDSSDKGGPKAMTSAYKYAMRQLLMIPSPGADPDEVSTEEHATTKSFPVKTVPAKAAPATTTESGDIKSVVIPFGKKYRGMTLGEVLEKDRGYIEWVAGHEGELQAMAKELLK